MKIRIESKAVTTKERWLGYLIGPSGALLLNAVLGTYLNIYYTDVLKLTSLWGGLFLVILPIFSRILNVTANLWMGQTLEQKTYPQGKARPWLLRSAPLLTLAGIFLFTVPEGSPNITIIWIILSYNFFYCAAFTIYNISHCMMVPLSTRNLEERGKLSVFSNISAVAVTGIIVALIFPVCVMPLVGNKKISWMLLMGILSVLALPCTILEYCYTRERITEEGVSGSKPQISFRVQAAAVLRDKYWLLIMLYFLLTTLGTNVRGVSLVYYCNYVLGSYNDGITQMLVAAIGGFPMGIGMFLIWPLAKRFGKRNVTLAGMVLMTVGGMLCWLRPEHLGIVLTGQFIKNMGAVPGSYVFMALFADVLDHLERKYGFRCDGMSMAVYSSLMTLCGGIGQGVFNLLLTRSGYIPPVCNTVTGQTAAALQSAGVQQIFIFGFIGFETITAVLLLVVLFFLDIEKQQCNAILQN